jgi:hypothetical protein
MFNVCSSDEGAGAICVVDETSVTASSVTATSTDAVASTTTRARIAGPVPGGGLNSGFPFMLNRTLVVRFPLIKGPSVTMYNQGKP